MGRETMTEAEKLAGLMAEFEKEDALIAAAEKTRDAGYRHLDAFAPYPVHGLSEAIGFHDWTVPPLTLAGGLIGCIGGFLMCWYSSVYAYPLNVGGRPLNSWPAFIPITFELTILCASLTAVFGTLLLNRLPQPYHPVFNVNRFVHATRDRFYLYVESSDPKFDLVETRRFLQSLGPHGVYDVEP
jgi:hypothetical protein